MDTPDDKKTSCFGRMKSSIWNIISSERSSSTTSLTSTKPYILSNETGGIYYNKKSRSIPRTDYDPFPRSQKLTPIMHEDLEEKKARGGNAAAGTGGDQGGGDGERVDPGYVPPWKMLLYDYTQNTSLHGVRYMTEDGSHLARKLIWSMTVIAAWSILIYYAYNRISYFFEYNKNVNVEVNYLSKLSFPAVTMCNQNTFKITSLADNGWYEIVKDLFSSAAESVAARKCSDTEFMCTNKNCVSLSLRCDLFPDCSDGSDELLCDPCALIGVTSTSALLTSLAPQIVNFNFEIQPDTYEDKHPLYVKEGNYTSLYLYHENNHWIFGSPFEGNTDPVVKILHSTRSPDSISTPWLVWNGTGYMETTELKLTCLTKNFYLLGEPAVPSSSGLNLSYLYEATAHTRQDFIQNCIWKGAKCRPEAIHERNTDMGICFTFYDESDMNIEQSGPGYGLSLTLNIEFYEYTKSSEDGLGIKLLMHQYDDVAVVAERGVAVSPGLYSFISVETTHVQNLEPPWGNCGETELDFYSSYSVAKCKMECETEYLNQECSCRDFYQPEKKGKPTGCEVNTYVDCAKPFLVEFKKAGNYCTCPTPCIEEAFVPTTSFAVVLGSDSAEESMDEETAQLRERLRYARETSHRVVHEKYVKSMRMFHILSRNMNMFERFTRFTIENLIDEFRGIHEIGARLMTDCIDMRDILSTAKQETVDHILEPMTFYTEAFRSRIFYQFQKMLNLMNETMYEYPNVLFGPPNNTEYRDKADLYRREQNETLWNFYQNLQSAIEYMEIELYSHTLTRIKTLPELSKLRLHQERIKPLMSYISLHCPYCVNANNDPLLGIIKLKAIKTIEKLPQTYTVLRGDLQKLYDTHMASISVLDSDLTGMNSYHWQSEALNNVLKSAYNTLDQSIPQLESSVFLLDDLNDYYWRMSCQTELDVYLQDYNSDHSETEGLLAEVNDYVVREISAWDSYQTRYEAKQVTLEEVGTKFSFSYLSTLVERKETRIETVVNKRIQNIRKLHSHISAVNYLVMTLLDDAYVSNTSATWERFKASIPTVNIPPEVPPEGYMVAQPLYNITLNEIEAIYWMDVVQNLEEIKSNLNLQVSFVANAATEVQSYFNTYIEGNKLTQSFYGQNFLQVELFYKELTERKVSQQVAYSYMSLLSEIGGLMGLLLGASTLSVFEILDLIIYNSCRKCYKRNNVRVQNINIRPS